MPAPARSRACSCVDAAGHRPIGILHIHDLLARGRGLMNGRSLVPGTRQKTRRRSAPRSTATCRPELVRMDRLAAAGAARVRQAPTCLAVSPAAGSWSTLTKWAAAGSAPWLLLGVGRRLARDRAHQGPGPHRPSAALFSRRGLIQRPHESNRAIAAIDRARPALHHHCGPPRCSPSAAAHRPY